MTAAPHTAPHTAPPAPGPARFTPPFHGVLDLYDGSSITLCHTESGRRFVITVRQDVDISARGDSDHGTQMDTWERDYASPDGAVSGEVPGDYVSRYSGVDSNRLNKYWTLCTAAKPGVAPSVWGFLSRNNYDGTLSFTPAIEADDGCHYDGVIFSKDDPDWGEITTETLAAEVAEYNRYAEGEVLGVTCEEIYKVRVTRIYEHGTIAVTAYLDDENGTEERTEEVDSLWGIDLGPRNYRTYEHERYLWDVISELLPVPESFTFPYMLTGSPSGSLTIAQQDANLAAFFDAFTVQED